MQLFIASLAVLFIATWLGFIVLRVDAAAEWPADLPDMPQLLFVSTGLLVLSSATIQLSLMLMRRGHRAPSAVMVLATFMLGALFMVFQAFAWFEWHGALGARWGDSEAYRFSYAAFYVLTALHGAHVVGGLIPLAWVTIRASVGAYSSERHEGLLAVTWYWHFLDVVWIVLLLTLWWGV